MSGHSWEHHILWLEYESGGETMLVDYLFYAGFPQFWFTTVKNAKQFIKIKWLTLFTNLIKLNQIFSKYEYMYYHNVVNIYFIFFPIL